jgi:hypothetical protein
MLMVSYASGEFRCVEFYSPLVVKSQKDVVEIVETVALYRSVVQSSPV